MDPSNLRAFFFKWLPLTVLVSLIAAGASSVIFGNMPLSKVSDAYFRLVILPIIFDAMVFCVAYFIKHPLSRQTKIWYSFNATISAAIFVVIGLSNFAAVHQLAFAERWNAANVSRFALAHFNELDIDGNGIIMPNEISDPRFDEFAGVGGDVIKFTRLHMDEVGHVVSVDRRDYKVVNNPDADENSVTYSSSVYGIDKVDLQNYQERALGLLKDW